MPVETPTSGSWFRHTDGGLYRFEGTARDSRDGGLLYLYTHVWPFPVQFWVRPADEWASRFTQISGSEVAAAMEGDGAAAQERVREAKRARRAASRSTYTH